VIYTFCHQATNQPAADSIDNLSCTYILSYVVVADEELPENVAFGCDCMVAQDDFTDASEYDVFANFSTERSHPCHQHAACSHSEIHE
jgi:hypothetical protein